jgi:fumarate reductase subunit C
MAYPRQTSKTWFLKRWPYRLFILRELSGVFLAGYTIVLLLLVTEVHNGAIAFKNFANTLRSPAFIVFNVIALLFALLHSATWFQAMPKALPIRAGKQSASTFLLIGANYLLMIALTAIVLTIVLA